MTDVDYITLKPSVLVLRIRLMPGASKNSIGGIYTDEKGREWLKASVTTVPEKGRANADLIALMSKKFKLRKSAFALVSGETDRHKTFEISDGQSVLATIRQSAQP